MNYDTYQQVKLPLDHSADELKNAVLSTLSINGRSVYSFCMCPGGILSAGIDGIKIAEAVALDMLKNA